MGHGSGVSRLQLDALEKIAKARIQYIIGIDEVGMGAWAGPVTVAAVVLPRGWHHPWVADSKAISPAKRVRALQEVIFPNAAVYCLLSKTSDEIDHMGIEVARKDLTESVALYCGRRFPESVVVQDGIQPVMVEGFDVICLPKADALVPAVSAASILAKVARDDYMRGVADVRYPVYGFASNKGYRSLKHEQALEKYGPCPIHRRSYSPIKNYC